MLRRSWTSPEEGYAETLPRRCSRQKAIAVRERLPAFYDDFGVSRWRALIFCESIGRAARVRGMAAMSLGLVAPSGPTPSREGRYMPVTADPGNVGTRDTVVSRFAARLRNMVMG